eukprot:gene4515-6379_t
MEDTVGTDEYKMITASKINYLEVLPQNVFEEHLSNLSSTESQPQQKYSESPLFTVVSNGKDIVHTTGFNKRRFRERKLLAKPHEQQFPPGFTELKWYFYRSQNLKIEDADFLCGQLGYVPYNLVEVSAFLTDTKFNANSNRPLVAKLYPLNVNALGSNYSTANGRPLPFPTMFWITCPILHYFISTLEDAGWVQKFQARLLEDSPQGEEWRRVMTSAHESYAIERWNQLTDEDRTIVLTTKGWEKAVRHVGIAGIHQFSAVKCLHCHYAHYISRPEHGNIVGMWVSELLEHSGFVEVDH